MSNVKLAMIIMAMLAVNVLMIYGWVALVGWTTYLCMVGVSLVLSAILRRRCRSVN